MIVETIGKQCHFEGPSLRIRSVKYYRDQVFKMDRRSCSLQIVETVKRPLRGSFETPLPSYYEQADIHLCLLLLGTF